jgi:hypothetical protein
MYYGSKARIKIMGTRKWKAEEIEKVMTRLGFEATKHINSLSSFDQKFTGMSMGKAFMGSTDPAEALPQSGILRGTA